MENQEFLKTLNELSKSVGQSVEIILIWLEQNDSVEAEIARHIKPLCDAKKDYSAIARQYIAWLDRIENFSCSDGEGKRSTFLGSYEDKPLHLIVSSFHEGVWIKPNRCVSRQRLIGLLMIAVELLTSSECLTIDPADCPLRAYLIVDDEQPDIDEVLKDG